MALPTSSENVFICATVGVGQGSGQLHYPHLSMTQGFHLGPYSRHQYSISNAALTGYGVENKSIVVTTIGSDVNIYGYYKYGAFSPLPVSALDTRYILPFCGQSSILVIAAYKKKTDVRFTFRLTKPFSYGGKTYIDGDFLDFSLDHYQTFTINFGVDVTGTVVQTTEVVAVLMGTRYRSYVTSYDQLLPVSAHGQEYVIAVFDASRTFQLQIVSDDIDNQIVFDNGDQIRRQFYRRSLDKDAALSFNTSRPVMVVLCRVYEYYSGFVVLPDVSSYSSQEVAIYPSAGINYVLKIITDNDANVNVKRYMDPGIRVDWVELKNTRYKVGTCRVPPQYSTAITSDSDFAIIAYHGNFIHNGRYRNSTEDDLTTMFPEEPKSTFLPDSTTDTFIKSSVTESRKPTILSEVVTTPMSGSSSLYESSEQTSLSEEITIPMSEASSSSESLIRQTTTFPQGMTTARPAIINTKVYTAESSIGQTTFPQGKTMAIPATTNTKGSSAAMITTDASSASHPTEFSGTQATMLSTTTKTPNFTEQNEKDCSTDMTLIVGLTLGLVIIILLVVIIELVYHIRRKMVSLAYLTGRFADKSRSEDSLL